MSTILITSYSAKYVPIELQGKLQRINNVCRFGVR